MPPSVPVVKVDPTPRPGDVTSMPATGKSSIDFSSLTGSAPAAPPPYKPAPKPVPRPTPQQPPPRPPTKPAPNKPVERLRGLPPRPTNSDDPVRRFGPGMTPTPEPQNGEAEEETAPEIEAEEANATEPADDQDPVAQLQALIDPEKDDEEEEEDGEGVPSPSKGEEEIPDDDTELGKHVQKLGGLKQVRAAHRGLLKTHKEVRRQLQTKDEEITSLREQIAKGTPSPEFVAELESTRKKISEYEARINAIDYTQSQEFNEKYRQPFERALEQAYVDIEDMTVTDASGQVRKATKEDFQPLLGLGLQEAAKLAKERFGEFGWSAAMDARRDVIKANRELQLATSTATERAKEARQTEIANAQARQEKFWNSYRSSKKAIQEEFAELFSPRKDDPEGNDLIEKGWEFVNALNDPKTRTKLSDEAFTRNMAILHHRAASLPRALLDIKRYQKRIAELEEEVKGYKKSDPKPGHGSAGQTKKEYSWEDDLAARATRGLRG